MGHGFCLLGLKTDYTPVSTAYMGAWLLAWYCAAQSDEHLIALRVQPNRVPVGVRLLCCAHLEEVGTVLSGVDSGADGAAK